MRLEPHSNPPKNLAGNDAPPLIHSQQPKQTASKTSAETVCVWVCGEMEKDLRLNVFDEELPWAHVWLCGGALRLCSHDERGQCGHLPQSNKQLRNRGLGTSLRPARLEWAKRHRRRFWVRKLTPHQLSCRGCQTLTQRRASRTADPVATSKVNMGQPHVVDIDGDGKLDIIVAAGDAQIYHYKK